MEPASPGWSKMWANVKAKVGKLGRPVKTSTTLSQCLAELNRFTTVAKLEQIRPEDVISAGEGEAQWFMLETKAHEVNFFTNSLAQPRIKSFHAKGIDMIRVLQWHKPTGKWSKEKALAETLRIVEELGMRFVVGRHEVYAQELPNAQGVKVTPLYHVTLYEANGIVSVSAVFRMGEAAPGQLVSWGVNNPDNW